MEAQPQAHNLHGATDGSISQMRRRRARASRKMADYAVEAALALAETSSEWILAEDALLVLEKRWPLHDAQLAVAPLHKVMDASY
ncbi:hypothetical protein [Paraburkholderia sp. XV]|uniref:hypothetical protein n=1 Tax=Paraburkholderia sp. XV TaxID=2831520 RepID=UPI001CD509B4|nr:hypothetical protein [Paraburkholderia sp. XV]